MEPRQLRERYQFPALGFGQTPIPVGHRHRPRFDSHFASRGHIENHNPRSGVSRSRAWFLPGTARPRRRQEPTVDASEPQPGSYSRRPVADHFSVFPSGQRGEGSGRTCDAPDQRPNCGLDRFGQRRPAFEDQRQVRIGERFAGQGLGQGFGWGLCNCFAGRFFRQTGRGFDSRRSYRRASSEARLNIHAGWSRWSVC